MKQLIITHLCRIALVSGLALLSLSARGDVTGFGGDGTGWTRNASANHALPAIAGDVLTILDSGDTADARSAWCNTPQQIDGAWTATFTYVKTARGFDNPGLAYWDADGLTFTLQAAGLNALGNNGDRLGYDTITPSAALAIKVYQHNDGSFNDDESGLGIVSGGSGAENVYYQNTGGLDFDSPNRPITFTVSYFPAGHLVVVRAAQGVKNNTLRPGAQLAPAPVVVTFTTTLDIPAALGANTAFVGFTSGTGSASMGANIGAFNFREIGADAAASNFAGLIHTPGTTDADKTGFANVTSTGGALSGLLFWQGYRFGVAGPLDGNGQFKVTIRKANTHRGRFMVTFSTHATGGAVGVTVDDGTTHADGLLLPAVQVPPGYFTAHFEPGNRQETPGLANGQAPPPGPNLGTGYARMRVQSSGLVKLVGRLPDGKRFSAGTVVTMLGTFPFYSGQYQRVQHGSAYGDFTFPFDGVTYSPMLQQRPPSGSAFYPTGFNVTETFVCNRYIALPLGTPVLPFPQGPIPNGEFELLDGNLPGASFLGLICDPKNRITFTSSNPMGITLVIYRRLGLFHGVFHAPGGTRKSFAGSIVQGENLAAGLFFGSTETGTAEFFPFEGQ